MVTKKNNKTTLEKLISQDKKVLAKCCNGNGNKNFKTVKTFEEHLIGVLEDERVHDRLQKMCCAEVCVSANNVGEMKIEFIFSNDECCEKRKNLHKKEEDVLKGLESLKDLIDGLRKED